jgi:acyl carrier protein
VASRLFAKLAGKKHEAVAAHSGPLNESDIQQWLVDRIARLAKLEAAQVDVNLPFAEFGLDSMQLFELAGDLEKFLGQKIPEVVAWDYPNIALLSRHLTSRDAGVPVSSMTMLPDENW